MKLTSVHETHQFRVVSFAVAMTFGMSVSIVGCSSDRSPPDDGKGENAQGTYKVACSQETAAWFHQCAEEVLEASGLTESERVALSSCDYATAIPESSNEDLFEVARATVEARCIFR